MTTIGELVKHLLEYPQDMEILQSQDAEGNSFYPVADIGQYYIEKDSNAYQIDAIWGEDEIREDADPDDGDPMDNFKKVLIIWPN